MTFDKNDVPGGDDIGSTTAFTGTTGRSVSLGSVALLWGIMTLILGFAFHTRPAVPFVWFAGLPALGWIATLVVAATMRPPTPFAKTSILAERLSWVVRAAWATAVIGFTAIYSAAVTIDVERHGVDASFTTAATGLVVPVTTTTAVFLSYSLPFQFFRAGKRDRHTAAETIAMHLQTYVPANWLERLLYELTHPVVSFIVCGFGTSSAFWFSEQLRIYIQAS